MAFKRQGYFAQKHQEEESFLLQLQREIDYEAIGSHLRTVREQHGCTQAEFSEIMHLSTNYYGLLETGSKHINLHGSSNSSALRSVQQTDCYVGVTRIIPVRPRRLVILRSVGN